MLQQGNISAFVTVDYNLVQEGKFKPRNSQLLLQRKPNTCAQMSTQSQVWIEDLNFNNDLSSDSLFNLILNRKQALLVSTFIILLGSFCNV